MQYGDLVGVYDLQSFEIEAASGASKRWGENARGLLIYEMSGAMSVSIVKDPESPRPADWDPMDDVLFYSGTCRVSRPGVVEHQVLVATDRERIGQSMVRNVELDGDLLRISNRTLSGGTAKLTWRRRG